MQNFKTKEEQTKYLTSIYDYLYMRKAKQSKEDLVNPFTMNKLKSK